MFFKRIYLCIVLVLALLAMPAYATDLTGQQILEKSLKDNFAQDFRISLSIKTIKGKKSASNNVLWLMAKPKDNGADFFVEFEEPPESRGLRFLFQMNMGREPKAFMYLPATGKTLPLALDNSSVDMGGTGLSVEDIQGFIPKAGQKAELLKEEKIEGHDCYVIKVTSENGSGEQLVWVSKKDFFVIKSQNVDLKGKINRIFKVTEFFKTEQGKDFPREEEILIPEKNMKIKIRQEGAVFNVELPDELMDPEKFGTFKWRN